MTARFGKLFDVFAFDPVTAFDSMVYIYYTKKSGVLCYNKIETI
jgi:hypothetical protein